MDDMYSQAKGRKDVILPPASTAARIKNIEELREWQRGENSTIKKASDDKMYSQAKGRKDVILPPASENHIVRQEVTAQINLQSNLRERQQNSSLHQKELENAEREVKRMKATYDNYKASKIAWWTKSGLIAVVFICLFPPAALFMLPYVIFYALCWTPKKNPYILKLILTLKGI
jgi:hypothetical protein